MSGSRTDSAVRESRAAGPVPRFEVPGWAERFGVTAGVTGRGDGGLGEEFDLGLWTDRPVGEVSGRWRTLRRSIGGFQGQVLGHQVHGNRVAWHPEPRLGWTLLDGVDGHATASAGLLLLVTAADCIPVYLVDPATRACALLHAGWRGAAAGILSRGVQLLVERCGSRGEDIVMHCGVGICGPCYEVGAEVLEAFGMARAGPGPWHLDLRARLVDEARRLGLGEATASAWCSSHDRDRFFSHRGSGGADGRMVAYLGFPSGEAIDGGGGTV